MSDSIEITATAAITAEHHPEFDRVVICGQCCEGDEANVIVDVSQCERLGRFLLSKAPGPKCDIDAEIFGPEIVLSQWMRCEWDDVAGRAEITTDDPEGDVQVARLTMVSCKILHTWLGNVIRKHSEASNA